MYHFLTASPEERQTERERQRRFIGNLPHSSPAAAYLSRRASGLLDVQFRLEDAALLLETAANADNHAAECKGAAVKYDIEAAAEAFDADEAFVGGASTQYKAAKLNFRQREEAARRALEEQSRL